ncbi:hypothetical protein C4572_01890, partial [Candidatus Parcubacteria bacterium]
MSGFKSTTKKIYLLKNFVLLFFVLSLLFNPLLANAIEKEDVADFADIYSKVNLGVSIPNFNVSIANFLSWIIYGLAMVMGWLISITLSAISGVIGYSDFTGVTGVQKGWVIIRDLCNMFFILILLVIAFATILRIESYNYKKFLPKLILMAVLINFSMFITGIIIEFFQVLMLSFINPIQQDLGFWFVDKLNIKELIAINKDYAKISGDAWDIFIAVFLVFLMLVVAFCVILVFAVILVFRIVMLWILVVLSPFAYFLAAFPRGESYAKRWWDMFVKWVAVGPLLAFFLWLSFTILAGTGGKISDDI